MPASTDLGPIDIRADERPDPDLVDSLRGDASTRVLVVRGDRAEAVPGEAGASLEFCSPAEAPEDAVWAFLGRASGGAGVLLASSPGDPDSGGSALREIAPTLASHDAALLTTGVALGRWLIDSRYCPACGDDAVQTMSGWARRCSSCGREHFPRTDPAVIVAITSADGQRLLLGANAAWKGRMYSCFAGFVEAGESAEDTLHRELFEEAGVRVRDVRYVQSQAWPYPRSLMLGFHATAVDEREVQPDGDEIVSVRWFTREEIGRGLAGDLDVRLPGGVSVAHSLIRAWYDAPAVPAR